MRDAEDLFGKMRHRLVHLACACKPGDRKGLAHRFLKEYFDDPIIDGFCRMVNSRFEPGSLWPKFYLSLLPLPRPSKVGGEWTSVFQELLKLHVEKDQSMELLVILDREHYPDAEGILEAFEAAAASYDWPSYRKRPLLYAYVAETDSPLIGLERGKTAVNKKASI